MNYYLLRWQDSDKPSLIRYANNMKISIFFGNEFTYAFT